jgi:ATP-dependent protease Clp ATPase subunit
MRNELLHFSSGLPEIAGRLTVVSEANRLKEDNVIDYVKS